MTLDDGRVEELESDEEENMGLDDLAFELGPQIQNNTTKETPTSQPSPELNKDQLVQMYIRQQHQQNQFNKKLIEQIATQNKVNIAQSPVVSINQLKHTTTFR